MDPLGTPLVLYVVAFFALQRGVELVINQVHERRLLSRGGKILRGDGLTFIIAVQVLWFAGFFFEGGPSNITPRNADPATWTLLAAGVLAQALRYWCIATLGDHWTIHVITVAGQRLVRRGPYRFFRHPNYVAVITELVMVPLALDLWITALVCGVLGGASVAYRIQREEKALAQIHLQPPRATE